MKNFHMEEEEKKLRLAMLEGKGLLLSFTCPHVQQWSNPRGQISPGSLLKKQFPGPYPFQALVT